VPDHVGGEKVREQSRLLVRGRDGEDAALLVRLAKDLPLAPLAQREQYARPYTHTYTQCRSGHKRWYARVPHTYTHPHT
jgi:hypothetical protein